MKLKICIWVLFALVVLINAFIFANSLDTVEKSYKKSDAVTEVVQTIIKDDLNEQQSSLRKYTRKSAHLIEFAALGISVTSFLYLVNKKYAKRLYGYGLFYLLSVAVTDEYIQSFLDRTSLVSDVILDFIGCIVGVVISATVIAAVNFIKNKSTLHSKSTSCQH